MLLLLQQLSADIDRTVYSGLNFVSRPQIISQCLFLTPSSEYTILNSQKGSKFVSFLYLDPQMSVLNVMEDGPRWCDVPLPPLAPVSAVTAPMSHYPGLADTVSLLWCGQSKDFVKDEATSMVTSYILCLLGMGGPRPSSLNGRSKRDKRKI